MKQLLFLLLFPCLALAQYTGNGNQKITLGEQTTADGLVFRGVANDTNVITPFSDTSAYIILDTVNSKFYHYNRTTTFWSLAGGGGDSGGVTSFSAGTTGLTPSTATTGAVTLGGTLAVANGGTNRTTMPAGYILHGDGTSVDTSVNLFWDRTNNRLGVGTNNPLANFHVQSTLTKTSTNYWHYLMFDNTAPAIGVGAGFMFGGLKTSTAQEVFGAIDGYKETSSVTPGSNAAGAMRFHTQPSDGSGVVERMRITSTGNVGIGTASPTEKLHVVGNGRFTGNVIIKGASENLIIIDGTTYSGFRLQRNGTPKFAFFNNNAGTDFFDIYNYTTSSSSLIISSDNETWLGYTSDQGAYKLQINGTPQATGALVVTSDEKFKENITPLNKGLEIVNKLKPVTYNFISDTKNNFSVNEEVGFIAQDVDRALSTETFAKSIVNSADDSEPTSTMGLATQNLIPILVKAIQEQQALIKALEQRILILENK